MGIISSGLKRFNKYIILDETKKLCSVGELPRSLPQAELCAVDSAAATLSFSSFSSQICFRYGTAFGLRPRYFGVGFAVEVDAASVPFATCPAAACAFLILGASFLMAFFRRRGLLVIFMAVVNEVALMPMST